MKSRRDFGSEKVCPGYFCEVDLRSFAPLAERSEQLREEAKQRKADNKRADADQKSLMA